MDELSLSQTPNFLREHLGLTPQNPTASHDYRLSKIQRGISNPQNAVITNDCHIIAPVVQHRIGQILGRIYARNGNMYKDGLAISRLLSNGRLVFCIMKSQIDNFRKSLADHVQLPTPADQIKSAKKSSSKDTNMLTESEQRKKIIKERKLKELVSTYLGFDDVLVLPQPNTLPKDVYVSCDPIESLETNIVDLADLLELKLLRHTGHAMIVLHTANYGIYSHFIADHVKALENLIPSYCIVNPVTGINWDSYYVRSMWFRPIVSAALSPADVISLIKSKRNPIILVGPGFSQEICTLAKERGIACVGSRSNYSIVSLKHKTMRQRFDMISYLDHNVILKLLEPERIGKLFKPLVMTSFCSNFINGAPICDFNPLNYEITSRATAITFQVEDPGIDQIRNWHGRLVQPRELPGDVLIVIGNKGSMKSTMTKYIVRALNAGVGIPLSERPYVGRIDSDTYGKWLQNGRPTFRSWDEFNTFQDDDSLTSYFEKLVLDVIEEQAAVWPHDDMMRAEVYPRIYAEVERVLQIECAVLLNVKDDKPGYTSFATAVITIPDVPKGLLWEVHYNEEVARVKAINILAVQSPLQTQLCVLNRQRDTSSPLAELLLHDFYQSRAEGTAYPTVQLCQMANYFGYGGYERD